MDWNDLKAFAEVARSSSLTEAARVSGLSVPTLSRRLDHLESELSLKLLVRSPSGVRLTRDGAVLAEATQDTRHAVERVLRMAQALKAGEAALPVRISATETVITTLLAPALAELRAEPDAPAVDFAVSYENANLDKREADLAIRLAAPVQDTLVARRLGSISLSLYSSDPLMLDDDGDAATQLGRGFILYDDRFGDIPEVVWARKHGLADRAAMLSSSTLAMLEAVKSGAGVGLLPDYLGTLHGLHRLDFPSPAPRSMWLVFHRDARHVPRVKRVRDWIVSAVSSRLREVS